MRNAYPLSAIHDKWAKAVEAEGVGLFAPIFLADQPSSSTYTQRTLGWAPSHPGLLEDLENIEP